MTITKEILEHCIKNMDEGFYWLKDIEFRSHLDIWLDAEFLDDKASIEYRVKPKTILVNGIYVPAPLYRIDDETEVYIANPALESYYQTVKVTYEADSFLCEPLERGLVHSQSENAATHGKAMLKYREV